MTFQVIHGVHWERQKNNILQEKPEKQKKTQYTLVIFKSLKDFQYCNPKFVIIGFFYILSKSFSQRQEKI